MHRACDHAARHVEAGLRFEREDEIEVRAERLGSSHVADDRFSHFVGEEVGIDAAAACRGTNLECVRFTARIGLPPSHDGQQRVEPGEDFLNRGARALALVERDGIGHGGALLAFVQAGSHWLTASPQARNGRT